MPGEEELPPSALVRACEDDLVSSAHHHFSQLTAIYGLRVSGLVRPLSLPKPKEFSIISFCAV